MRGVVLLWILAVCAFVGYDAQAVAQQYAFRSYRQTQGLENLSVTSLANDRQGFLWVGTENGVYRFLGSSFQRFGGGQGVLEQTIKQVFTAPDGTLWVVSDANLYFFNGRDFQPVARKPIFVDGSAGIASDGPGRLLVLSRRVLYRLRYGPGGTLLSPALEPFFAPGLIAAHPSLAHLGSLKVVADGTLWMGCGRAICSWREGVLTEWGSRQGVAEEFYPSILEDQQGDIWAVSEKHILELAHSFQAGPARFIDRSPPGLGDSGVYNRLPIACDPLGRVIVSFGDGLARWNGDGWDRIGSPNGLVSTHLTAFLFDERGDLWMGSTGDGLHHWIGYADWRGWTDRQGLPSSNIWSIGPFQGDRVWVGTEKGPATIDVGGGKVDVAFAAGTWTFGQVTGMIEPTGDPLSRASDDRTLPRSLLSTASGALIRMEGNPARLTQIANLQHYLYGLFEDSFHRIFVVSGNKVLEASALFADDAGRAHPGPPPVALPQIDSLLGPQAWVTTGCMSPDTTVWFNSENGVLRLADRDHWSRPRIEGLGSPLPRLSNLVCAADGSLWINSGDSDIWRLVYKSDGSLVPGHFEATRLMLPTALQSSAIVAMLSDVRGWLWIGTDDGLLVWNGSTWRQLTQEDGLVWNDVNAGKMRIGPDGAFWVDTSGGLSRLSRPQRIFESAPLRIGMIDVQQDSKALPFDRELEIPWSRHDLSFQFAAPDALNRAGLVFHYRMAGLQPDWITSKEETAHFLTPPGNYTFEVFAQDRTSGVRSKTIFLRIQVTPPWWRTTWFYLLCVIAVVLVIVLVFKLRTNHLLSQQRRLERVVLERTAQLEASREELRRQAMHDGLTGLLNRGAMMEAFEQEMVRAQRTGTALTLILADLDHFKKINDTYGHLAGDEALRRFATALTANIRPYDYAGRFGGEEFLLVLVACDSQAIGDRLVELHQSISGLPISYAGTDFVLTCSLGVVQLEVPQAGNGLFDHKSLLALADEALYEAKRAGRNRFIFGKSVSVNQVVTPVQEDGPSSRLDAVV